MSISSGVTPPTITLGVIAGGTHQGVGVVDLGVAVTSRGPTSSHARTQTEYGGYPMGVHGASLGAFPPAQFFPWTVTTGEVAICVSPKNSATVPSTRTHRVPPLIHDLQESTAPRHALPNAFER